MRSMLKELGLEEERLQLNWISASEGEKFSEVVRAVTEQVRQLGPSILKPEGVA
nr:hydrogenase iron-sulfur subunit [Methanosarcina horonobensis]